MTQSCVALPEREPNTLVEQHNRNVRYHRLAHHLLDIWKKSRTTRSMAMTHDHKRANVAIAGMTPNQRLAPAVLPP